MSEVKLVWKCDYESRIRRPVWMSTAGDPGYRRRPDEVALSRMICWCNCNAGNAGCFALVMLMGGGISIPEDAGKKGIGIVVSSEFHSQF